MECLGQRVNDSLAVFVFPSVYGHKPPKAHTIGGLSVRGFQVFMTIAFQMTLQPPERQFWSIQASKALMICFP